MYRIVREEGYVLEMYLGGFFLDYFFRIFMFVFGKLFE